MKIGVVGTGYVGLVSGTCFAEFGTEVVCVDNNAEKIEKLRKGVIPIFEPGLDDLVEKQVKSGRLSFSTQTADAVKDTQAVFIAVGTPPCQSDGHADLTFVYEAAREIARNMDGYTVVVTKSTVPVGTSHEVERVIREENPNADFDVCSNPEFLREGAAINDFMRPDRVVIGVSSERARQVMRELYRPLYINETPIVFTSRESSEIIKYASNAFLATKITFINEIANLCEKAGGNVQDVARAMGMDGRIGSKFLHAGPGYGGSCFPKDTLALTQTGRKLDAVQSVVESVVKVNAERHEQMAYKIMNAMNDDVNGKKIAILGIAFKPQTDDIRDAPALRIIDILQRSGANIAAFDPEAMPNASKAIKDVEWCDDPYVATENADAVVIVTEWNEFRRLDLKRIGEAINNKLLIDLRNIYKIEEMEQSDWQYISIGRPNV